MVNAKLSYRYAKALLDLSVEQNSVERVLADITLCKANLDESKELRVFFSSPVINPDKKIKTVEAVFGSQLSLLSLKFIQLLIQKHRESAFYDMCKDFIRQYNALHKIGELHITSAAPLHDQVKAALTAQVKSAMGMDNMVVTTSVDTNLLGGFVLQFDNKQYDASIQSKLRELAASFETNDYIEKI